MAEEKQKAKEITPQEKAEQEHFNKFSKMSVEERKKQYSQIDVMDRVSKEEIENAYFLIGTNNLMSNYGAAGKEYGTPSFIKSIGSKYAQDKKLGLMSEKTQKNKSLGIDWYLPTVSDQDLNTHIMELAQQAYQNVKLSTLEGILSDKNKNLDFSELGISSKFEETQKKAREYEIAEGKKYEFSKEEEQHLAFGQQHRAKLLEELEEASALQIQSFHLKENHRNYIEQMSKFYPGKKPEKEGNQKSEETPEKKSE
jgi:hypothetical protein